MPDDALSPQDFAAKIRAKYPGSYDGIPDMVLTQKVLAKYPEYGSSVKMPAPLPSPNPMGMANRALAGTGIQVGPPKSGVQLPEAGPGSRFLTSAGAAVSNLPNPVPGQGVGQFDPKTGAVSGDLVPRPLQELSGAASGIKQMISGPAQQIGSGDVAGGLGAAAVNYPAAGAMMKSAADMAVLALPSKVRASANYSDVMSRASTQPVDTTISRAAAENVKTLASRGGQMPKVVKDFLRRMNDETQGPLTYKEAEDFISKATGKTATDIRGNPLKGKDLAEMVKFRNALRADITEAVGNVGMADQYRQAVREYAAGSQLQRAATKVATGGAIVGAEEFARRKLLGH